MSPLEHELLAHAGALRRLARELVGSADADDLVQETALRALRSPPRAPTGLGAFLATILRRLAWTQRSERLRRERREQAAAQPELVQPAEQALQQGEVLHRMTAALMRLALPYRQALLDRYFEDLQPTAIARRHGVPVATVKTRLQRGLQKLREELEVKGEGRDWRGALVNAFGIGRLAAGLSGVLLMGTAGKVAVGGAAAALAAMVVFTWSGPVAAPAVVQRTVAAADQVVATAAKEPEASARTVAEAASEAAPVPANARWASVQVVDHADGKPVAGAEVAWMDGTVSERIKPLPREAQESLRNDPERLARTFGWHSRSDADGMVRVHLGLWGTNVFARSGTRYGSVTWTDRPPSRLELSEDVTLAIQVIDHEGRPAVRVPVAVERCTNAGKLLYNQLVPSTEAPEGRTWLRHLQTRSWPEEGVRNMPWCVRTKIPGLVDPGVAFDPKAPPRDPIVLQLPVMGSVAARVTFQGQPVACEWMGLNLRGTADAELLNNAWQALPDPDGWFRFPWLPLDATWLAMARPNTITFRQEFVGPTASNRQVTLEIALPEDGTIVLKGRCVDEQGRPLSEQRLNGDFRWDRGGGGTSVVTDRQGCFLWFAGQAPDVTGLDRMVLDYWRRDEVTLRATISPRPLVPGVNDLGDLRFSAGPLVVAGRFLGGDIDQPNTWPQFVVERRLTADGKEAWESCQDVTRSFLGGGRFEVHGETSPVRHRLVFSAWDRHAPLAPVEFQPGDRDLQIVLIDRALIEATVLLPHDLPQGLEVELRRDSVPVPRSVSGIDPRRTTPRQVDGERYRLLWQAVPAGTYTLAFLVRGIAEPLATIEDVKVPLPPVGDPRLRDIDLRERVRTIVVHVTDRDDRPVDGRILGFVQPQDPAGNWLGLPGSDGDFRMAAPQKPIDLLIVREGLPPKLLLNAQGEMSVKLEPWPQLQLVMLGLPPLGDAELIVWANSASPPFSGRWFNPYENGQIESLFLPPPGPARAESGKVTLALSDGPQPLSFYLERPGGSVVQLKQFTPLEVTAGAVPLEIRFSTGEAEQALGKLRAAAK